MDLFSVLVQDWRGLWVCRRIPFPCMAVETEKVFLTTVNRMEIRGAAHALFPAETDGILDTPPG